MIKWIREHKWKLLLSSLVVILPALVGVLFWDTLPDMMTTHWGADGSADSSGSKVFAVFVPTGIMLALHWVCLLVTGADPGNREQSRKTIGMLFWIIPFISLFTNGILYSAAFGKKFRPELLTPIMLGLMFVVIGNNLPKVKQNRTLGIKISWTLNNEENWNKTHRFSGKLWVGGGLLMIFSVFLPMAPMIWIFVMVMIALIAIPTLYSYLLYRKHKKEGIVYRSAPKSKGEVIAIKISAVLVTVIMIGVGILMFTGEISYECGENSMKIKATYWGGAEVAYDAIDALEYRESCDAGYRSYGFGSARLSMGNFQNDEFGAYTRYTYTRCDACVVLEADGDILVIGAKTPEETKELYNLLVSKRAF